MTARGALRLVSLDEEPVVEPVVMEVDDDGQRHELLNLAEVAAQAYRQGVAAGLARFDPTKTGNVLLYQAGYEAGQADTLRAVGLA